MCSLTQVLNMGPWGCHGAESTSDDCRKHKGHVASFVKNWQKWTNEIHASRLWLTESSFHVSGLEPADTLATDENWDPVTVAAMSGDRVSNLAAPNAV